MGRPAYPIAHLSHLGPSKPFLHKQVVANLLQRAVSVPFKSQSHSKREMWLLYKKDVLSRIIQIYFLFWVRRLLFFLYVRRTFASGFFAFSQAVSVSLRSHPWWKVNDHIYAG